MTGPELCRLCAETKESLIGIYDAEGQKLAIEAKIAKCLQIQVELQRYWRPWSPLLVLS